MTAAEWRELARLSRMAAVAEAARGNEANELYLNNVSVYASRMGGE